MMEEIRKKRQEVNILIIGECQNFLLNQINTILNYQQSYLIQMNKILLLALTLIACNSLYTPSYWKELGINVTDGILEPSQKLTIPLDTVCNEVNLNRSPFNYNGTVMSGYLRVPNKGSSAIGFIFYGRENTSRADLLKYPVLIWLNGGPGSSSQLGNMMQLGPFFIKPDHTAPYTIVRNNYTWVKQYSVLFVDQPVGTGLSYADPDIANVYVRNMDEVANDFYGALQQLYQHNNGCFNKLNIRPSQDLIIFGESYAGKYAPAIGVKIKRQQQKGGFLTGLKGVAIGDGFTHPFNILQQMGQFAFNMGLLDYQERSRVEQLNLNAAVQDRARNWRALHNSFGNVLDYIKQRSGGVNVYDITSYHSYPTALVTQYFSQPSNIQLFSLNTEVRFGSQSSNVYEALFEDFMKSQTPLVEQLLRLKTPVLVYNGQNDLIVQTPGTFKWVERLNFVQSQKFRDTFFTVWKTAGKTSGFAKQAGFLELKTVNNAGHLVPMDQGEAALNLATTFVRKVTGRTVSQQDQ